MKNSTEHWIVHEHCTSTSAIDRYWLFDANSKARAFYCKIAKGWEQFIDKYWLLEVYEVLEPDQTFDEFFQAELKNPGDHVVLEGDDYLTFAKFDGKGFARRP